MKHFITLGPLSGLGPRAIFSFCLWLGIPSLITRFLQFTSNVKTIEPADVLCFAFHMMKERKWRETPFCTVHVLTYLSFVLFTIHLGEKDLTKDRVKHPPLIIFTSIIFPPRRTFVQFSRKGKLIVTTIDYKSCCIIFKMFCHHHCLVFVFIVSF